MYDLLVKFQCACCDGLGELSHLLFERLQVALEDGGVDLAKRLLRRERDVEHREQRDKTRINFVAPTTSLCIKGYF